MRDKGQELFLVIFVFYKEHDMFRSTALSTAPDALQLAGALVLLVRALEQYVRSAAAGDTWTLTQLGLLGQIECRIDRPSLVARALRLDRARIPRPTMQSLVWHDEVSEISEPRVALVSERAGIKRRCVTLGTH
jgi:hypothetical protein